MTEQQFYGLSFTSPILVIGRGEPGVGKTTTFQKMKEDIEKVNHLRVGIFSTDNIFINADGEYEFVPWAIGAAHMFESHELILSMRARDYDVYFLDNTNLQRWEYLSYLREAMYENFRVMILDLRGQENYGNIHGVPEDKVKQMAELSDNPYPPHIESYYAKNQEYYDWVKITESDPRIIQGLILMHLGGGPVGQDS